MGFKSWLGKYTGHRYRKIKTEHETAKGERYQYGLMREAHHMESELEEDRAKLHEYIQEREDGYITKGQFKKLLRKIVKEMHGEVGDLEKALETAVGAILVLASGVAFYYPKYTGATVMSFQDKVQVNTSLFLGLAMFALGMILLFRKK